MLSARFVTVFVFAAGLGFVAANCGGDDSGSSTNNLVCPSNTGGGTCTAEQNKTYSDCIMSKCDSAFQTCYGAGYKSGNFSGPCQSWIACYAKCACNDMACRNACGFPMGECLTCATMTGSCVSSSGCMAPVCTGSGTGGSGGGGGASGTGGAGGGGGGSGTCADLMKCCASMTNAQLKMACDAQYNALKSQAGGDSACGMLAAQYKAGGLCTY